MKTRKMLHETCRTTLDIVRRQVTTQPEDRGWPAEAQVHLFYCRECKVIVNAFDVKPASEED